MKDIPNDIETLKAKIAGQDVTIKGFVEVSDQFKLIPNLAYRYLIQFGALRRKKTRLTHPNRLAVLN